MRTLTELMQQANKEKRISATELLETLAGLSDEAVNAVYAELEKAGVVIDTEDIASMINQDKAPSDQEIGAVEEEELVDPGVLMADYGIHDPIRLYLREIGRVGLLTPERVEENKYKKFGQAAVEQLQKILMLKYLDFSLEEIGEMLEKEETGGVFAKQAELLRKRKEHLEHVLQAVEEAGYRALDPDLDRTGYQLRGLTNANSLLRSISGQRNDVSVWLADTVGTGGLRSFLSALGNAEGQCLAWTETA